MLNLLDKSLIPAADNDEAKVYYYKMKGDYHRYYAEIESGSENQKNLALDAYTKATQSIASLKPTSPIRLGLALNFSVFYYEILKSPDKGCQLARQAFEEALSDPEVLNEEQHKEAALIMQLLRDNLALWTEDSHPEGGDDGTAMMDLESKKKEKEERMTHFSIFFFFAFSLILFFFF
ncbi:tyrosine 3-monooxygenase/tryptophan 5-monooxygenase activation protein [Angomonas deanei]|nr:tyrosine 3-monooxygenase/tryptophan 5-monooxygenase activation protein [Angomonas deanei]EPY42764.1 tyrosine 3-monooxygenase/tryptophan 5-monooxygenase activation protein [Angomonas deanei]EPY43299.1 tyrosine 3-monooxygenase/tryptophan 5-monooxygenase activation protein [Angomonas deanei]|eukprot:EPY37619.1 tyrosine 3-monooxygenase/tryptophan 5-monooxygenase activation protein [Angomonas deanei]